MPSSVPVSSGHMRAKLRNNDQILHGENFLQGRSQMLTHDVFAVDNLLDFLIGLLGALILEFF